MSATRALYRAALIAACLHTTAYAQSSEPESEVDDVEELGGLLRGDGSEFESRSWTARRAPAVGPTALVADESGSCCSDGDCICRGGDPDDDTPNGNGPFRVSSFSLGFGLGRSYGGGTVYYPTNAEPPLSGVVLCPGYTALQSSIADWGPFFASHGIVLVTIDTNTTLDLVPQRADALLDALADLKRENTRVGSPLRGQLSDDRYGLAGWSMGGGGTWIATAGNPELKTAVTLAGHNATAGGGLLSLGSRVPTLMLNGATDATILGGLGQSEAAYDAIPNSTPKLLYVMAGEGHFSWGTPRTNNNASGRYVLSWEKVFLEGDERYLPFLLERGPRATTWRSNLSD